MRIPFTLIGKPWHAAATYGRTIHERMKARLDRVRTGWATRKQDLLRTALIIVAGFWVFWPTIHGDWLMDDDMLVTANADVRSLGGLWPIWFELNGQDYFPLADSAHWLEWQLWGMNPVPYHLVNIALHLSSALLIWRLLARLGLRLAWVGGLIFTIHPLTVESVAWISELKNTLSLPLLLLAMNAYLNYEEEGSHNQYLRAALFFLAAMLCKTSVVMFPVLLLFHAWWRRGRISRKDLKASAVFFGISLVLGFVTVWFQHNRSMGDVPLVMDSVPWRIAGAILIGAFYLSKSVLPVGLVPVYPRWEIREHLSLEIFLGLLIGLFSFWLWTKRHSWGRPALFGFGFFLINLVPVSGVTSMAWFRMTWVADHLAYLPLIGLIGLTVTAVADLQERWSRVRLIVSSALVAGIVLFGWHSHRYASIFRDKETVWTFTTRRNPDFWQGHNNLGLVYNDSGRAEEAVAQFQDALRIKPDCATAQLNWGVALVQMGRPREAILHYREALRLDPAGVQADNDWGNALAALGRYDEAIARYREALQIDPDDVESHTDLGVVLMQVNRIPEGIGQYEEALRLDPDSATAHYNLGIALGESGSMPEAVAQFEATVRLTPEDAAARYNLAMALIRIGRMPEAAEQLEEALRIKPDYEAAKVNLQRLRAGAANRGN